MLQTQESASAVAGTLGVGAEPEHCAPDDPADLAALLSDARAGGKAVIPWGGGTEQDLGAPPTRADVVMHTDGLRGILAYAPEDLTLSVRSGTTLAEIAGALAAHRQFLPLDLPLPERATIGGVVGTAAVPIRRLRYGGVRDLVIGLEVALPDGTICKSGGRVVKNVAGYDLCKLFTGSLGTLGVIITVNLKVQPLPAAQAVVTGRFERAIAALRAGGALAATSLGYGGLILTRSADGPEWTLHILTEGFAGTLEHQVRSAREALAREGGESRVDEGAEASAQAIGRLATWRAERGTDESLLRGAVAPARLGAALQAVEGALPAASLQADVGTGTFFARAPLGEPSPETAVAAITALRAAIGDIGGHLVLAGGPRALRAIADPWGAPPQAEKLARAIKGKIDPDGVLNPGRFAYRM